MTIITRFAPSPTGSLHIGGARTALFNYLFAKKNNGKFLLRIEDTDQERSTQSAKNTIIEGLDWIGLSHDDKIIFQSQNISRHQKVAQELIDAGNAYLCYTPAEELEKSRQKATENGQVFKFNSPWRDAPAPQNSDIKPVVRVKAPQDGDVEIKDLVQGKITISAAEIDDMVILRSDGTPTYMLAAVVDDHDMGVTHIIRGDDHLTNASRQKIIYDAMGWQVPNFAHIPLIHGSDGSKLSKRHGATNLLEYQEMGYLPDALRNYLLRLGWSHGDAEIISDKEAQQWFNLENIGKSPSRFDSDKLDHINKHYIKSKSSHELLGMMTIHLQDLGFSAQQIQQSTEVLLHAFEFLKEGAATLEALAAVSEAYIIGVKDFLSEEDEAKIAENIDLLNNLKNVIADVKDWQIEQIKKAINQFAQENNLKFKDFGPILRICLTFSSSSSGGLFDIMAIFDKEEVLRRINLNLENND